MKTNVHYSNVRPIQPNCTWIDTFKALGYIFGLFFLTVILLAGADCIDQLLLWFK